MPRDATILSAVEVTIVPILEAAAQVAADLHVRTLFDRAVLQLVDAAGDPVLSIQNSTLVPRAAEVARLLPSAPPVAEPIWFTEALLPWGDAGERGKRILYQLAQSLDAALVIEDAS
ncbi:hypothetical protein [Homoserinimonas sp. OAct 916]|uniref:hypothetical protein n=1 Tax=Homoserinimonas sp. OAct 916 TaxID=2211450 RepID=UPI000DBE6528|nr:hypothetical protein [Homoserinimonas sp. OAct 916]